jgi:hypothetical protein
MRHFRILILSAYILSGATVSMAQTTIGSLLNPAKGALLDLKSYAPDADNATSKTGGLLLPRVQLNNPNDFSLLPDLTDEQKKNHTGLMVYNLKEDDNIEKGVYQWNGEAWRKLNTATKTENVVVRKKKYSGSEPDANSVVPIGIFEFRMIRRDNQDYPQFRLAPGVSPQFIYRHVNEYWDNDTSSEAIGTESGYSFRLIGSSMSTRWVDCINSMVTSERNEIWLADSQNGHMFQIQFIIINNDTTNTYIIIAKRY